MVRDAVKENGPGTEQLAVRASVDLIYGALVFLLAALGILMQFSAGSAYVDSDPYLYLTQHLKHLMVGLVFTFGLMWGLTPRSARIFSAVTVFVSLFLLALVLLVGTTRGGAKRWLIFGGFSFQPSELAKTALILLLSLYLSVEPERFRFHKKNIVRPFLYGLVIPLTVIGMFAALVLLEKHLSGTAVIVALGVTMMFLGGIGILPLLITGGAGAGGAWLFVLLNPYTMRRIEGYFHRGSDAANDWQTNEGLYAMGTGGFFGRGIGSSQLKYGYVSQPQNDFIFSVIVEELGAFGASVIILLFAALVGRGFRLALHCRDRFFSLVIAGLSCKMALQVILNVGVVTALLPNTGISLPFFSSGGSNILVTMLDMGLVLGMSRYCHD